MDASVVAIWALVGSLVLYLAFDGGGYAVVVHSQVAIVVWWMVLVGAAAGLLPATRLSRAGWGALALLSAFVAWTALGITWSISSERSLGDLSLVTGYLGILVLGVAVQRDRARSLHHTLSALSGAIVIVAALAVASRLHPGLFPAATQTSSFIPDSAQRLAWPLNYWNALAALMAFGLPLLLGVATSARTLYGQAAAAAGIPIVALCGYLTFSRGGALAAAVAVALFILLAPERFPKVATALVTAGGSAALIAGASDRSALERGLVDSVARHQGTTLVLPIVLVCVGVALAQVAIGLAARHGTPPRIFVIAPNRARWLLAGSVVVLILAAVAVGAPGRLSHAWNNFKSPPSAALEQASVARFGNLNSNGRYELWKAAFHATRGHVLAGSGPGAFQLLWLPRAVPGVGYVQNAHSLYFETLAELGVVGLALLVGFLLLVLGAALRLVAILRYESRTRAAAAVGAVSAFLVSAGLEWIWQMPVLPAAFLLLAASVLAPGASATVRMRSRLSSSLQRLAAGLLAAAALVAIGVPLAMSNAVHASQVAAAGGNSGLALRDAEQAANIEPDASTPQVQLALVEELRRDIPAALSAARRAVRNEPANWSTWLIISRLDAEAGQPRASFDAFRRARALNPISPVFAR